MSGCKISRRTSYRVCWAVLDQCMLLCSSVSTGPFHWWYRYVNQTTSMLAVVMKNIFARFGVLTALLLRIQVFWDVILKHCVFLVFRRIILHSKHWKSLALWYSVVSYKAWILKNVFIILKFPCIWCLYSPRDPRLVLASHWTVPEGWTYCTGFTAWCQLIHYVNSHGSSWTYQPASPGHTGK